MATAVGIDLGTTNSVIATVVRFRVRDKLYAPEEIGAGAAQAGRRPQGGDDGVIDAEFTGG